MRLRLLASAAALTAGVVAVVIVALLLAPLARADGDPASDYLLTRPSFVPPDAGISGGDQKALNELLIAAKKEGYALRVAIVPSQYDMGSVTVLWKRPADYAPFLSQEVRFLYKGRILVAMPNGWAIAQNGKRDPAEQAVVAKLASPKPFRGAPLAAAAESAVRKLTARAGITLPKVAAPSGGGSSTTRDRILIGIGAAIVLLLVLGFSLGRRRGLFARGRSR